MTVDTAMTPRGGRDAVAALLILAALFALFELALPGSWPHPIRPDDYSNVAGEWSDMALRWKRPVSSNAIFLVSEFGIHASYGFLWLLAVVDAALVLLLVARVMAVRVSVTMAAVFGMLVFSHQSAFDHATYLGLITNLVSHLFGLATLFALLRAWRDARWRWWLVACAMYVLTALAKEDFLLPPLLLMAWLMIEDWRERRAGRGAMSASTSTSASASASEVAVAVAALPPSIAPHLAPSTWPQRVSRSAVLLALGAAVMAWSAYVRNPFIAGLMAPERSSASYAVDLSPSGLASALRTLLVDFSPLVTAAALLACALICWQRPARRLRVAWLLLTVLSLALPYALISNSIAMHRAYAWLPWLAAVVVVAMSVAGAPRTMAGSASSMRARALLVGGVGIALAGAVAMVQLAARAPHVTTYQRAAALNVRIVDSLLRLRPALVGAPQVGLTGLGESSPWCAQDAAYVNRKLGFAGQRWVVFVDAPTRCYTQQVPNALRKQGIYVSVVARATLCARGALPVIEYAADGSARLRRASDFCGAPAR